ncbi:MAG: amidohydrolase [Candidatus Tectomicrobia bacterium]|nr:amidohydrolase [Candidatus Tectomicrobia bacterium]
MASLAIRNGTIITCDPRHRILRHGCLVFDGERITAVLAESEAGAAQAEASLDAAGCVVIPGLINAHTHMQEVINRGLGADLTMPRWLSELAMPSLSKRTPKLYELGAMVSCIEMLKSGTTYVYENPLPPIPQADAAARAIAETGLRGSVAPIISDRNYPAAFRVDVKTAQAQSEDFVNRWQGAAGGRLQTGLSPSTPAFTASRELVRELSRLATQLGVGFTTHVAESTATVQALRKEYGAKGVVFFLEELGVLNARFVSSQSVHLLPEELPLFAAAGVHVANNPSSNMFLGNGIAPVRDLLAAGVNVALGCDAPACNNVLDMLAELKIAALAQKVRYGDPTAITTEQVLDLATRNAARAVGLGDELGSLEVGKLADVVIVDMTQPHCLPGNNPLADLVYSATGRDVKHVFIGGRQVVRDGNVTTVDEQPILTQFIREARAVDVGGTFH